VWCNKFGTYSKNPIPPLIKEKAPTSEHVNSLGTNEIVYGSQWGPEPRMTVLKKASRKLLLCPALSGWRPVGPQTKNDCACEVQQQMAAVLRVVTGSPVPLFNEEEVPFQSP
jgi:hypothetical protein